MILLLGVGFYAWRQTLLKATGHDDPLEAIAKTFEMVTGETAIVVSEKHAEHPLLTPVKVGIKLLAAAAILQSAVLVFWRQIRRWKFRHVDGHHVFIGWGSHNAELALRALDSGAKVILVGSANANPLQSKIENGGALLIDATPGDSEKTAAASLTRAARIIVGCQDDAATVAVAEKTAEALANATQPVELLACVESHELRDLLAQRWRLVHNSSHIQTRIVSFRLVAIRALLDQIANQLAARPTSTHSAPRILCAAGQQFTEEFLSLAIPFLQFSGDARPVFFVCSSSADCAARFQRTYPQANLVADVRFLSTPPESAETAPELRDTHIDFAVAYLSSEVATLALADRLLRCPLCEIPLAVAVTPQTPSIALQPDPHLCVISLFEYGMKSPEFGDLTLESAARQNHEAYLAGLTSEKRAGRPNAKPWDQLSEAVRESNRWAVLHRKVKLAVWDSIPAEASAKERQDLLELLARSEHQRWMGEKIMNGWMHGPKRDDARRVHHEICPYDALDEGVKDYDRTQVHAALGLVS